MRIALVARVRVRENFKERCQMFPTQSTQKASSCGANIPVEPTTELNSFDNFRFAEAAHHRFGSVDSRDEGPDMNDGETTLEETAEREQEYLRRRLRDELQREPTEDELNEWLRQHTEGY